MTLKTGGINYICFCCIFYQINAALMNTKRLLKTLNNLNYCKLVNSVCVLTKVY